MTGGGGGASPCNCTAASTTPCCSAFSMILRQIARIDGGVAVRTPGTQQEVSRAWTGIYGVADDSRGELLWVRKTGPRSRKQENQNDW